MKIRFCITLLVVLGASLIFQDLAQSAQQQVSFKVSARADDAFENMITGGVSTTYGFVYPGMKYIVGYRFDNVAIQPGATILSARLLQYGTGYGTQPTSVVYYGEETGDSSAFSATKYNLSTRPKTGASVSDNPPAWTAYQYNGGPDLKNIVQEIVNLPDWQSGNHLTILSAWLKTRRVDLYDANPLHAAILEVTFDDGVTPIADTIPPTVTILNPPSDYQTADPTMDITGNAFDNAGVISVTWQTDSGRSGTAAGTAPWSIKGVALNQGPNTVTVMAHDASGNVGQAETVITYEPVTPVPQIGFEGFGQAATGGTGYTVYTARSASELTRIANTVKVKGGNSIINLEGNWTYTSKLEFSNLANFTLNGIGSSVTFDNAGLYFINCDNFILQGLRVRRNQTGDDSLQINSCRLAVIDHCSVSEAGDGNMDITGFANGESRDITISYCILANTWKQQLVRYNLTTNITFHHNLYYNSGGRVPHVNEGNFDFRNNVVWQWGSYATTMGSAATMNIVNNYYGQTPGSSKGDSAIWYTDATSRAWISGNVLPASETDKSRLSSPLAVPAVVTQTAAEARISVLDQAGASPRDAYDQQVVDNVRKGVFPPLPPYHS